MNTISKASIITALLASSVVANALTYSAEATNNATIQPGGPRTGSNGKNYLNIEGSSYSNYASYGVVDFSVSSFGLGFTVGDITSLKIALTESNASFTKPGSVRIYLVSDTVASIDPSGSSLVFDSSSLPGGLGSQLGTIYSLGTGVFSTSGNVNSGTVDEYSLTLSNEAKAYMVSQLNNSAGTLRFAITPETDTTAATWAGYSHSTYAGPTLSFDAAPVPEPATIVGLALGASALISRRRRK